ncbi:carbonic anhydrase, chloroplastic-like isoform X3 [Panicum virgatum]|uniref:carbonic anhydrase, chloroplastic-like isoform X3 n=1 Tax=Panicum virgatum TaxID=38727 RepID=UPI0019D53418|nr:carbonic anhydrase, chloroplastic-like isoform X3 [Panicum virgatum]
MFSFAGRASTASSIVASLATPAPPSKPSSPAASARRPRLIMSAPVFAAPSAVASMDAVERLKSGFEQFKTQVYDKKPELFEPLKAGQCPRYMVFACADSRCCPSVTLGLQPGEAFTIRNIAAMVPPYDKNKYAGIGAAIEYAVCALKVEVLTVIGHSRCGGIRALLSLQDGAADTFHFVEDWVRIGYQAKKKVQKEHPTVPFDDQCSILEKEAVNVSLYNLLTYPWVKEGVANGTLKLVGARYDFVNGVFDTWEK